MRRESDPATALSFAMIYCGVVLFVLAVLAWALGWL